jgi:hypothetical protein
VNSFLRNKLKNEKIGNNLKTLLPNNMGGRTYLKRIENEMSSYKSPIKKEEKKNATLEASKDPFATKVIKNLIKTEKELQKKIQRIEENEKLIKNRSFLNLFNKNPINLRKDKEIIKSKVNDLSKNKSLIISRADYINSEIFNLQNKQDVQSGDFKNKILQNMNKLNQNLKEKNQNNKTSENGVCKNQLVRLLDAKEEEKILEEQKLLALKHMREIEREGIKKRKEKTQEEVLKKLKYRNEKPKKEYYLYEKLYNNYLDREDNLIKKENAKRRAYMRHIDSHEFLEMEKNYLERKIQIEENMKENKISLKQEWTERQKLIPSYDNPFIKLLKEEKVKLQLEKELKLQKLKENKYNMINFSNKLRKPQKWKEKLDNYNIEKKKENNIKKNKIFNQSLAFKNDYSDKIRKKLIKKINKNRENSKENKKEENINKIREIKNIKLNSPQINKRTKASSTDNKINNHINNTDRSNKSNIYIKKSASRDFLAEKRNKPKPKLNNIYANDIKKFLKKSGITENSLLMSKCRLDYLKEKKEQKNRLLKLNGGIAKNPEVGEELYNLSLNIIKGKLAIIEEIEKKFDKNGENGKPKEQKEDYSSEEESENELSVPEDKNREDKES